MLRLGRRDVSSFGSFGTIGLEIVLSVLVGFLGGRWLDGRFGTTWIAYVGLAFGIAAAGKSVWRGYRQAQAQVADEEREEAEARAKHLGRGPRTSTGELLRQVDDALAAEDDNADKAEPAASPSKKTNGAGGPDDGTPG